jgi:hypothetical protein
LPVLAGCGLATAGTALLGSGLMCCRCALYHTADVVPNASQEIKFKPMSPKMAARRFYSFRAVLTSTLIANFVRRLIRWWLTAESMW